MARMAISLAGLALGLAPVAAQNPPLPRSPYDVSRPAKPQPAPPPAAVLPKLPEPAQQPLTFPAPAGVSAASAPRIEAPLSAFVPAALQAANQPLLNVDTRAPGEDSAELQIQLTPPGLQRVSRLESQAALFERMRQEARERPAPERIEFPPEPDLSREPFQIRRFPRMHELVEPNYVCYGRLFFEERNSERYGWDLGILQPVVSTAAFYWDFVWLPYHIFSDPCRKYDCNAGYCLPGDPVPYLLYPPGCSLTGLFAEAAVIGGLIAMFP